MRDGFPIQVKLGQTYYFYVQTTNYRGVDTDASAISADVYEQNGSSSLVTVSPTKLNSKTGFYVGSFAATAANGFEASKDYVIYLTATVSGVSIARQYSFRVLANTVGLSYSPYSLGDTIYHYFQSGSSSGIPIEAGSISAELYDQDTATPLTLSPTYSQQASKTGFYSAVIAATTANGFTADHTYCLRLEATISGTQLHRVFVFQTQTNPVTGSSSASYTNSFLSRTIDSIRRYTDEPATNEKYTDANLIDEIQKAYPQLLAELNRNRHPHELVTATYSITYDADTTLYVLPPNIESVVAIYYESDHGYRTFYDSRSPMDTAGRGVSVQDNTLYIQNNHSITDGRTLTVEYIPSNTALLHNGECTVDSDGDTVTLTSSPNAGSRDTHYQAYTGCYLRILSATSNNYVQERLITAYDHTTLKATLNKALSPIPGGTITYEIAPPIHHGLDDVIGAYVALMINSIEKNTRRYSALERFYRDRLRNVRLAGHYKNLSQAPRVNTHHYNNSRRNMRRR